MANAIGETLPLGLGIALNPMAIVVGILILRKPGSRENGIAYLAGWIVGLTLLVTLSTRLIQLSAGRLRGPFFEFGSWLWIALGVLLLVFAIRAWRSRPLPGEPRGPQRWTGLIDRGGVVRILGFGMFLSIVSLKNLALLAAAAGALGQAGLALPQLALSIAAFVAVSSLGILIPLLVRLFGGQGADARLERWGNWLVRHMGTFTAVVLALLGAYLIGQGVWDLF